MSDQPPEISDITNLRHRTARAAADRQGFLAGLFARYQAAERIDDDELARRLAVTPDDLPSLALCRLPRDDRFAADITAISDRFHADRAALANIVRQVAALSALAAASAGEALLAARDADDEPPPEAES